MRWDDQEMQVEKVPELIWNSVLKIYSQQFRSSAEENL
jgi:hypothetical protein